MVSGWWLVVRILRLMGEGRILATKDAKETKMIWRWGFTYHECGAIAGDLLDG